MSFLERAANNVLQATEEISARMEEGISAIMSGELPKSNEGGGGSSMPDDNTMDGGGEEEFDMMEEELMHSPLEGIADSVIGDLMANSAKPQGIVENLHAFRSAITWTEPFVLSLIAFQVIMFIVTVLVSRRNVALTPRFLTMVFIAGLVRLAERMNRLASNHWDKIATQNYFDKQGVFVAIMFCCPLLLDCLIMLISFLSEASQLLITVKTNEMRRQRAAQKEQQKKETPKESKKKQ